MDEDRLRLYLAKRIRGLMSGQYASGQLHTRGHDLEERRPFHLGDDPRTISIIATAKKKDEKLRVSVHRIERGINIIFLVDSSASARFGTVIEKYEYTLNLAERIAQACLGEGNRFRFLAFDSDIRFDSGYKLSENDVQSSIEELALLTSADRKTDFKTTLQSLDDLAIELSINLPGIVFVISDFIFEEEIEFGPQLANVADKCDVLALILRDPAEINLPKPWLGLIELTDPETGKHFWARAANNPLDKVKLILRRCEVDWLELITAEEQGTVLEKLADYFEEKKET